MGTLVLLEMPGPATVNAPTALFCADEMMYVPAGTPGPVTKPALSTSGGPDVMRVTVSVVPEIEPVN